jgi:hydroxymethylglutaryl-CoA lyase
VYEVGPRDGLQNETATLPTAAKVEFIDRLARTGLPYVEASSFVHPRWIPQLADAEAVFAALPRRDDVRYGALVPNMHGLKRATAVGLKAYGLFVSASEIHNRKNLNRSIDESLGYIAAITDALRGEGVWIRAYVSMVWGSPFGDEVTVSGVVRVCRRLLDLGIDQISLGDTVGRATPRSVQDRLAVLLKEVPADRIALHFHDTRGTALANVVAGLDAGVRVFDGAVGGLGGCPYAAGASGNLATEDLVQMLHSMGIHTGIDLDDLVDCAAFIEHRLGKKLPSHWLRACRGPYRQ